MAPSLHPLLDAGITKGTSSFPGGTLRCHCASSAVEIHLASNVAHNHACGCSKCWRPSGSLFSIVGVVPSSALTITSNGEKLKVVDPAATIQRHACSECGVHLFGRIEKEHAFKGLDFVHVELSEGMGKEGWQEPQFAGFVSSVLEQGLVSPGEMDGLRQKLKDVGLETYDCLSPPLMDALAVWSAKKAGVLKQDA